jgi:hypothetical protein
MENKSCFDYIVHKNFPEADFWLINKGAKESLGKPTRQFEPYLTGIKCPALILPDYQFYLCLYLYDQKFWYQHSIGSINLKHLRLSTIKDVFAQLSLKLRLQHKFWH